MAKIFKLISFLHEYLVDCYSAIRFGAYSPLEEADRRLYYRIVYLAHTLEKGMSLGKPRVNFGREKIRLARQLTKGYSAKTSTFPLQMLAGALQGYLQLHERLEGADPEWLAEVGKFLEEVRSKFSSSETGGVKSMDLQEATLEQCQDPQEFLRRRFSCRAYESQVVDAKLLEEVVRLAQSAPSQCNRQSVRAHVYTDRQQIDQLLELQGGTKGFTADVHNLFVIGSELTCWGGPGQRSQAYVDGALFSMQLMLACQAYGLATCPLNLAVKNKREKEIKKAGGIHPRERLIMMISFGWPQKKELKAANSPRRAVEDVLIRHEVL